VWSHRNATTSPSGERFFGVFQNDDVRLTLGSIPAHAKIRVTFDVYAIDTWDRNNGSSGPDQFRFGLVGATGTDAVARNTVGYLPDIGNSDRYIGNAIYRISMSFPHTGSTLELRFAAALNHGGANDERRCIDTMRVTIEP
jgi:hypothetical protein